MFDKFDNPLVASSKSHWRIETPFGEAKGDDPKPSNTGIGGGGGGGIGDIIGSVLNPINRELSNAGNSVNSAAYQATGGATWEDVLANVISGGILGYDTQTGGIKPGAWTRGAAEGIGELTGANAARSANNRAEALIAEQRAEAARLREEELARIRRNDVSASRAAGTAQRRSLYAAGSGLGSESGAFNNLTRDFLGL